MVKKKKPKTSKNPTNKKNPSIDPPTISEMHSHTNSNPAWQFSRIDTDVPWGLQRIDTDNAFFAEILPKLQGFESMRWNEILGKQNHEVHVSEISSKAQKRFRELKLDEFEHIVSLRFTGEKRLWGIKNLNILKIIWWDPHHEVYPSLKKGT